MTSFAAYQPRTFALNLAALQTTVAGTRSRPVALPYTIAGASNDGTAATDGFDGKSNSLPAEMLPQEITFNDVQLRLAPAKAGVPDAMAANGQTIDLPSGHYNRVYVLAASADGDQQVTFEAGGQKINLNLQSWNGFIGQWDDRQWGAKDVSVPARALRAARTEHDDYAEVTGIKPGYIKRASLAWYCSHHHNAKGENVPYEYSYLFAYPIDLPAGTKSITLPHNEKLRILAISAAEETPEVKPAQPLYDTLGRSEPVVQAR